MRLAARNLELRVTALAEMCRRQGIKGTHQRREVYRELVRTDEHPGAETIFRRVRRRIPAMSLDTVYRTLRMLEQKGVISRVGSLGDRARYDAKTEPHHHFVCTTCGVILDVPCHEAECSHHLGRTGGLGSVHSIYIELRGICRKCHEAQKHIRRKRRNAA